MCSGEWRRREDVEAADSGLQPCLPQKELCSVGMEKGDLFSLGQGTSALVFWR